MIDAELVSSPRPRAAQWLGVVAPPLAAFLQQQLAYTLVSPTCRGHFPLLIHAPAAGALLIGVIALAGSALGWRRAENPGKFLAMVGVLLSAMSILVIVAQWLPTLYIDPCAV